MHNLEQYGCPFIAIEGIDGVGKTTVSEILARLLHGRKLRTPPRFFGRTGRLIDLQPRNTSTLLYYLSSVAWVSARARELIKSRPVVCDRYLHSTIVYHSIYGNGELCKRVIKELSLLIPDVTVHLKASKEIRESRLAVRGGTLSFSERLFQDRTISDHAEEMFDSLANLRIDTTALTPREVAERIRSALPTSKINCSVLDPNEGPERYSSL
jgi:dTMP kinase